MQYNFLYLLPLAVAVIKAATIHHAVSKAPMEGYSMFVPQWEVEAFPGGETLILSGTVEEVLEKLREINPTYDSTFLQGFNATSEAEVGDSESLGPRADFTGAPANCDSWEMAQRDRVLQGIRYLENVPGKPHNSAGPAECGRVSCGYNAAIVFCNDNKEPKSLDSFKDIADGARDVDLKCRRWDSTRLAGQVHHKDKWNVIVRWEKC